MFVRPGTALEAEDRLRRFVRAGADAGHRHRDQPRLRIGPVLRHDERPAVGRVAAVLGVVGARVEEQVAGERTGRDGDGVAAPSRPEVRQAEDDQPDEDESDDSCACEARHGGFLYGPETGG